MLRKSLYTFLLLFMVLSIHTSRTSATPSSPPGVAPDNLPLRVQAPNSIVPYIVETGKISLSMDALGTMNDTGTIQVNKPSSLAFVRKAYLFSATTGFFFYTQGPLEDGDVSIGGLPVNWSYITPSSIYSYNHFADVTTIVKSIVDLSLPGQVDLTIKESDTLRIDGEVLVVIFDDLSQSTNSTVALLFGAQNVSGDLFEITFDTPIDKSDPNLFLDMSLGISFGAQGCNSGQYSIVEVNGTRLTTSAGGEDDGVCDNGALITIGGLEDSNTNPVDPYQLATTDPRYDDELYDLKPFVNTGDTNITVTTANPSSDDNIFLAVFHLSSQAIVSTQPKRPVIFIPGFGGSRLNEGIDEIWPAIDRSINNNDDLYLNALILTEEGQDPSGSTISVGEDIVRRIALVHDIYDTTIETLIDLGYKEGETLFVFPYDFRKDIEVTAGILEEEIRNILGSADMKVDIIAHSQGGLVTKQCIVTESCASLVHNAAILGTPFAGVPQGLRLLEYGQRIPDPPLGWIMGVSPNRAKIITQNWPNVYELIASEHYFTLFGEGYFVMDRDLDNDGEKEGRFDYNETRDYLSTRHNADLVTLGENFQLEGKIDDWQSGTNNVNVVIFAGSGLNTLTEIREYEWGIGPFRTVSIDFDETASGDETVPLFSVALKNQSGVDYTGGNVSVFYLDRVNHGKLPKNKTLLQYIVNIFANAPDLNSSVSDTNNQSLAFDQLPPPPANVLTEPTFVNGRQFLVTGPVEMEAVDEQGNRTVLGEDGTVDVSAIGTTFNTISNTTSIFFQESGMFTITIKATDIGFFDLKARTIEESQEERFVLFSSVPVSSTTTARLVYNTEASQSSDRMEIDHNGDGEFEETIDPDSDISGEDLHDATPPKTTIEIEGDQRGGFFLNTVVITLTAIDNQEGSGVAKIIYSLDNGETMQEYISPLTLTNLGKTDIHAFAVDNAGNIEDPIASTTVDIIQELKIYLPMIRH